MADAPPRPSLLGPLACTAASLAIVADQLRIWWLGHDAEVAHLLGLPPLELWVPLGLLALGALALALLGRARDPKLARVPLLALVVVLFVKIFVASPVRPFDDITDGVTTIQAFSEIASESAHDLGRVPATASELNDALTQLGPPAYLVRGEPLSSWKLVMRAGCDGPALDVTRLPAATLVYCLARDRQRAWVTGVGRTTPLFGPPQLIEARGQPVVGVVQVPPAPDTTHE